MDPNYYKGNKPNKLKSDVVDTTGAGDAFNGGFVTSIADGYNLRDSILRGSASASITVSRPGCAPAMADIKTLKEFMADHPGPTNK